MRCTLLAAVAAVVATRGRGAYDEREALGAVAYAAAVSCGERELLAEWRCRMCREGSGHVPAPAALREVTVARSADGINQALVGFDGRRAVVAFRGSVSAAQWIFNLDARLVHAYAAGGCHGCRVHAGFLEAYEELQDAVVEAVAALEARHGVREVLLTGHSLGAAMATHAALALAARGGLRVEGYTFGQPRVGDAAFAAWAREQLVAWYRVVNYLDPVVQAFKLPGYRHMTQEVWYYERPVPGAPPGPYRAMSATDGEDPRGQDSRCGGFKLCVEGAFHVTYMNLQSITNETLVC